MFDRLFAALKSNKDLLTFSEILAKVNDLTMHFEDDYLKDGDFKDAAIDEICELLQSYKVKN